MIRLTANKFQSSASKGCPPLSHGRSDWVKKAHHYDQLKSIQISHGACLVPDAMTLLTSDPERHLCALFILTVSTRLPELKYTIVIMRIEEGIL